MPQDARGGPDSGSAAWASGTTAAMSYALLNRLTAKPGQRERVMEILLESGRLFEDNLPVCSMWSPDRQMTPT